ncbi:hypothetical protein ES703_79238 [subsurface metagenome]
MSQIKLIYKDRKTYKKQNQKIACITKATFAKCTPKIKNDSSKKDQDEYDPEKDPCPVEKERKDGNTHNDK